MSKATDYLFPSNGFSLFSNATWLISVEVVAKLTRLITLVVAAFYLTPTQYGVAMVSLATHDIFRMLMRSGAGSQIVQCTDDELPLFARNAATLQCLICFLLATIQFFAATLVASVYNQPQLEALLQVMAISYLLFPWVSVHVYNIQRQNKLRQFSIFNGICIIAENLSIACFLYLDFDLMAFAYSKIVFSGLWLILFSRTAEEKFGFGFHWKTFKKLTTTSAQLLTSELFKASRMHLDTFVAGKVLAPELFGFYSFAKSSGIGLSQSISNAFNGALFPYMCKLNRQQQLSNNLLWIYLIATALGLLFVIQAWLAPVYIPFFFDSKWSPAINLVSILCLCAVATIWLDSYCSQIRAQGYFGKESQVRGIHLLFTILTMMLMPINTPESFAYAMLISSFIWILPIHFFSTYRFLKRLNA